MHDIEEHLMVFVPVDAAVLSDSTDGIEQLRVSLHTSIGSLSCHELLAYGDLRLDTIGSSGCDQSIQKSYFRRLTYYTVD
jgi:hypothetical protein